MVRENEYHLHVEIHEPRTFTRRLESSVREEARAAIFRNRQLAEDQRKAVRKEKLAKQAQWQAKHKKKAAKAARKAIERAKPAPKPAPQFKQWHAYRANMPGAEFYRTREWVDLRYRVLVKFGAQCQCCGASRKDGTVLHVDHIKPRSKYPALELVEENLQVLCEACNIGKSNTAETDWR